MTIFEKKFPQHYLWIIVTFFGLALSSYSHADTDTEIWKKEGLTKESINHNDWQNILDKYITAKPPANNEPSINFFNYKGVSDKDKNTLLNYLETLQAIDPRAYPKDEQFAYWVNLYNSLTVNLILENYPVKSITKLGPLLSFGPWDEVVADVAGEELTLNDIEHKILRPIWKDPRIHYAVNCASYSCPNLSAKAFTATNHEALLEQGAKDYINHPRGLSFKGNTLELSKIYKWYAEDFGKSEKDLLSHISQYATTDTAQRINTFDGKIKYDYDWSLNETK